MKDLKEEIGFPSKIWFSDHLPVGAIFAAANPAKGGAQYYPQLEWCKKVG